MVNLGQAVKERKIFPTTVLNIDGKKIFTNPSDLQITEQDIRNDYSFRLRGRGLWCTSFKGFFGDFPPSSEFYEDFLANRERFGKPFDQSKINSQDQALYLPVMSTSLAMQSYILRVVGENGIKRYFEETGTSPTELNKGSLDWEVFSGEREKQTVVLGFRVTKKN